MAIMERGWYWYYYTNGLKDSFTIIILVLIPVKRVQTGTCHVLFSVEIHRHKSLGHTEVQLHELIPNDPNNIMVK